MSTEVDAETVETYVDMIKGLDLRQVANSLIILVLGLIASRMLVRLFGKLLKRSRVIDPSAHTMLKTALRILLDVVFLMMAANAMGIPITSFVALLSIVGIAVSLAVQGTLSNVVGGIIILASHPFSVGDFVEQDGFTGTVKEIGLLHTRMQTPDGRLIYVPNATLQTSRLINYSVNPSRRIEISVSASYAAHPSAVRTAVLDAIAQCPDIQAEPAPIVHLETYGDSAITYTIYCWAPGSALWNTKYQLNEELYSAFLRAGVEMTYPHINVHLDEEQVRVKG
ncbi:MAG: mechanosensitive ion channel family protein [Clostridia bacterium]|nr:mechanosensitive ion channel family protein [Clostridia bacterium]